MIVRAAARRTSGGRALAAGALLAAALACGEPAGRTPQGAAGAAPAPAPDRVVLDAEAIAAAGIATEVVRPAPFAATVSLVARLSPVPETPEEVAARLAWRAAASRDRLAGQELERVRRLAGEDVLAAKTLQAAEAASAEAKVDLQRTVTALRELGLEPGREPSYPRADIWALADLYAPQASQVRPGARAWIAVDSLPDESFPGKVVALARFLKPETRTLTVRIAVEDPRRRLRPQDVAQAGIQVSTRDALSVPAGAVLYDGADRVVFVRGADGFRKVRVRTGPTQSGRVEILEGLADGDAVVTRGAEFLLGETYKVRAPPRQDDEDED